MTEKVFIKLEPLEAASIAELLLSNEPEIREVKVRWAIKLIKACIPEVTGPSSV